MPRTGSILAAILLFAVGTLWVGERWAVCGTQCAVFACSGWVLLRSARREEPIPVAVIPLILAGISVWGVMQIAMHWTSVPADTADTAAYWLAAACLAFLALDACAKRESRIAFLEVVLWVGSAICLVGLIQLFTSHGRVFWLFPSGFDDDVIGPFVSRNQYAAMVELLLPLSLVLSFRSGRRAKPYLVLSPALVAAVIASGSRAGTAIILAELAAVVALLYHAGQVRGGRELKGLVILILVFTVIVGYQHAWNRFRNSTDPFEFRREFVESTVAMARAQPLHGFGLGTWPSAYRQFALIDTGTTVLHSHNEWLQWAAEGGLPVLALMLAVAAVSFPAAVRSIWGLGIPAVFLHAVVDYPFFRMGLAAWIFVFLGAVAARTGVARPRFNAAAVAAVAVPILAFAAFHAFRTARADALYRMGTCETIARAAEMRPDRAEYALAQAHSDPVHVIPHLRRAVALNPYLTDAQIMLAAQLEQQGDAPASEDTLLGLTRRDRLYAPRWALANFYFRTGQREAFWQWARAAAQIAPGDVRPLFILALASSNDSVAVLDRIASPRRDVERQYLEFLLDRNRLADARIVAFRIATGAKPQDRAPLLDYVDRAVEARQFVDAAEIWNRISPHQRQTSPDRVVNGDFSAPILGHGFDWRPGLPWCAVTAQTNTGGPALELFLSGSQPENCRILYQFVFLSRGGEYEMHFQYRTADLPGPTGLHWSFGGQQEYTFRASSDWSDAVWHFRASDAALCLALEYRRVPGSTRHQGSALIRHVRLERKPAIRRLVERTEPPVRLQ